MRPLRAVERATDEPEPQIRQFIAAVPPGLRSEYHFLRSVCAPDARAAHARSPARAETSAPKTAAKAVRRVRGVSAAPERPVAQAYPDPRKLIQEGLAAAVEPSLTPDQAAAIRPRSTSGPTTGSRPAIRNIVARLDQDLVLTADQRDKLGECADQELGRSLVPVARDRSCYGDQYFPDPRQRRRPRPRREQTEIWNGSRRTRSSSSASSADMTAAEDPPRTRS